MSTTRGIRYVIVCLALVATAASALAGEGRTPIWRPTSIGTPGKYVVTRNITSPGTIIEVTVDGVDIDLNGMLLETVGLGPIITNSPGVGNIGVRNGHLRGGSDAVAFVDGKGYTLEDLDIAGGGGIGALLIGTEIAVRRLNITDRVIGVFVDAGPFPATSGVIADSVIVEGGDGILVERASSFTIRNNEVERMGAGFGIRVGASRGVLISENTIEDAPGEGLVVESNESCKIYNNVVTGSGAAGLFPGNGISLIGGTSGCLVLDNVSSGNAGSGLIIDGLVNHIENNAVSMNGAGGLVFTPAADGNTYGRNTGRFNGPPPGPCATPGPCPAGPDFCDDGGGGFPNTSRLDNVFGLPVC